MTISGTMAETLGDVNALRYRGYVYDHESGLYYLQSRYYDPAIGRFINADALVATGQDILGNNMFAYCGNEPIGRQDPSGYVYDPSVLHNHFFYCEVTHSVGGKMTIFPGAPSDPWQPRGTIAVGVGASAAFGASVSGSQAITADLNGNIGNMSTGGFGATFPSIGGYGFITFTNADTIDKQNGLATQVGGSISLFGLSVGLEHSIFLDPITNEPYHGISIVVGFDVDVPFEMHGGITYSDVDSINITDLLFDH